MQTSLLMWVVFFSSFNDLDCNFITSFIDIKQWNVIILPFIAQYAGLKIEMAKVNLLMESNFDFFGGK